MGQFWGVLGPVSGAVGVVYFDCQLAARERGGLAKAGEGRGGASEGRGRVDEGFGG